MRRELTTTCNQVQFQQKIVSLLDRYGQMIFPYNRVQLALGINNQLQHHLVLSPVVSELKTILSPSMPSNAPPAAIQDRAVSASASSSTGSLDDEPDATRQDRELGAFRPEPKQPPLPITMDNDFSLLLLIAREIQTKIAAHLPF